jgi:monoamine oxidase
MSDSHNQRYDCVVLGAGLAGLYAAYLLRQSNFSVCVLEARERVGGRVLTLRTLARQQHAELGPEFIDSNHHRVIRLAERFNLTLSTRPDFWGVSPTPPFGRRAQRAWRQFWNEVYALAAQVPDRYAPWHAPESLRMLDCVTMRAFAERLGVWAAGEPLFRRYAQNMEATEPENLSIYSVAAQEAFYGKGVHAGLYRFVDGTDSLPHALADAFCALGGDMHLNAPVEAVEQTPDGVRVYARQAGKPLTVQASYAIVALPFPVLTQLEWRPALAPWRVEALQSAGKGAVIRTLIQFRRRFWRDEPFPRVYAERADISAIWEETDLQAGESGVLSFWTAGDAARCWASLSEGARIDECLRTLEAMYPDCRTQVIAARSYDWQADPFAQHAYIHHTTGYLTQALPLLRQPEGRIHFAGDYLSLFVGYMEGALESGERARKRRASTRRRPSA